MENRKYWSGTKIEQLAENEIFVYGANPEFRNGSGGAKAAINFGAKVYGSGRGIVGSTLGIITKNLKAGFVEKATGLIYEKEGFCSVSKEMICQNIAELYKLAMQPEHQNKRFLITYQYETYTNGKPKKSLNGYTSQEMLEMFAHTDIPSNIVFHDSYQKHLEKLLQNKISVNASPNNNTIAFTKVDLPYGWMGNMSAYPVIYNGIEYKTTESLFQSLRFTEFPEVQKEIMEQTSPMAAKMVAKKYKHLLEDVGYELMGEQDVKNMYLCVKLKLEQHPNLAQDLMDTQNKKIIEDCSKRPQESGLFWGAAYQEGKWIGKNILGHVLMDYREQLQNNQELTIPMSDKPQYTYFFQATSPFSQWHPSLFTYRNYDFICAEQFMMFSKAKTFNDDIIADKIINIEKNYLNDKGGFDSKANQDCYELIMAFKNKELTREEVVNAKNLTTWKQIQSLIKKLGREVSNYDDTIWSAKRVAVVSVASREKYSQNLDLKEILMAQGDNIMVEASPYDKIWGIGLSEADAKKMPQEKWPGLNLLGDILTDLKLHFKNELIKPSKLKV